MSTLINLLKHNACLYYYVMISHSEHMKILWIVHKILFGTKCLEQSL
jgi:hypothetical protein